jgi:hypothetical protein
VSDEGIILFRKLLEQQIDKVARGEDPMNTFRDPATNQSIPIHSEQVHGGLGGGPAAKYNPEAAEVRALFTKAREMSAAGDD